ncbi:TPA: succinate--CoA ligase subunit alpha [Candidatus Bathyarchaeota archaeon]|nr:succinate--CoA ligase subunit alpha [Candidatus Bathyarchaeota archaeon]
MGILIDQNTVVMVQGITGRQGSFHTQLMLEYGTKIAVGVTPGKGGATVHGVPVFDTVKEALEEYSPNASIIFVPAESAAKAAKEAIENGMKILVIVTEGIPIKDSIQIMALGTHAGVRIIGPNTPGIVTPGECKLGIMPHSVFESGKVGIVSRSGTLTYEIAAALTQRNVGQSTCVGIGGDPITGLNFIEALELFRNDPQTKAIVLVGEIGGNLEEITAQYIAEEKYPKPVLAYIAGLSAPPEKRMGHAGAIILGQMGTAKSKIEAFEQAGVKVAKRPAEVVELINSTI